MERTDAAGVYASLDELIRLQYEASTVFTRYELGLLKAIGIEKETVLANKQETHKLRKTSCNKD